MNTPNILPNLSPIFNQEVFEKTLIHVTWHFHESAPVVSRWCDVLHELPPEKITLADIALLWYLHTEETSPVEASTLVVTHLDQFDLKTTHQIPLPHRPTVGDRVMLLKDGAEGTSATPPLVEGQIYIIQEDDKCPFAPFRLQGEGSWVSETDIALVS